MSLDLWGYGWRTAAEEQLSSHHLMVPIEHLEPHNLYDPVAATDSDYYPDLVRHVRQYGVQMPVTVETDGELGLLADGNHRMAAAREAGLTHLPVRFLRESTRNLTRWGGTLLHPTIQQHLADNPDSIADGYDRQPSWSQGEYTAARLAMPTYYHRSPRPLGDRPERAMPDMYFYTADDPHDVDWETRAYGDQVYSAEIPEHLMEPDDAPRRIADPDTRWWRTNPDNVGELTHLYDPTAPFGGVTAARLAMPMQDAYDDNWPDNGDVMDVGSRPDKLPNDIPIFPGPWYHGSDDDFGPGDVLTSQTPDSKVNRRRWTFMTDEPGYAQNYGKNIYEVEPLDEGPYPWNGQTGVATNHYVSPRARVVRKINLDDMAGERGRQRALNFYLKHYPDLFKKNARLAALNSDLADRLHAEFHDWAGQQDDPYGNYAPNAWYGRGPIGHWPAVERFLKDRYPAAHKDFDMGWEQARHMLDRPQMMEDDYFTRYETGPEAVAKHGYDPAEIAAGMLLLHNQTHPHRWEDHQDDLDRLTDIVTKRHQMQKQHDDPKPGLLDGYDTNQIPWHVQDMLRKNQHVLDPEILRRYLQKNHPESIHASTFHKKAKHMTAAVTVYTKPSCPQCTMTKKVLDKLGIEHDTVDVTADPEAHAYVTGLGYQQAPVVVVGDGEQHWSGFSPDRLKGLISE